MIVNRRERDFFCCRAGRDRHGRKKPHSIGISRVYCHFIDYMDGNGGEITGKWQEMKLTDGHGTDILIIVSERNGDEWTNIIGARTI